MHTITLTPSGKKNPHLVSYGYYQSPFGQCLIALCDEKICNLSFMVSDQNDAIDTLKEDYSEVYPTNIDTIGHRIFENHTKPLSLLLRGTPFQQKVWSALLDIPSGKTVSYSFIAKTIEKPTAVRAVANAIANNPISYIIPCHRVISKSGALHGYRWGLTLKKKLLLQEKEEILIKE